MKSKHLPISQCHSKCPKCGIETDYLMFESGGGGNFETYYGIRTNTYYRLDMHKVHYMNLEEVELLKPATEAEGGNEQLRNIPDQVTCKACGHVFRAAPIVASGETQVQAVEL